MTKFEYEKILASAAITELLDKGVNRIKKISEDEIQNMDGNPMMSKEFVQSIYRKAKELAEMDINELSELMFDIFCWKQKEKYERYETIAYNAIVEGQIEDRMDIEDVCFELGCSEEEFNEIMGYEN